MHFKIKRDILLKSLNFVQGVVEKKNTLPILSNVLLQLKNNKLSIATSADRAYGRVLRAEWILGSFAKIKSQNYKHAKSSGFSKTFTNLSTTSLLYAIVL